jgi:hypothetical protein
MSSMLKRYTIMATVDFNGFPITQAWDLWEGKNVFIEVFKFKSKNHLIIQVKPNLIKQTKQDDVDFKYGEILRISEAIVFPWHSN